jgi:hypothetical protein
MPSLFVPLRSRWEPCHDSPRTQPPGGWGRLISVGLHVTQFAAIAPDLCPARDAAESQLPKWQ